MFNWPPQGEREGIFWITESKLEELSNNRNGLVTKHDYWLKKKIIPWLKTKFLHSTAISVISRHSKVLYLFTHSKVLWTRLEEYTNWRNKLKNILWVEIKVYRFMNHNKSISWSHKPKIRKTSIYHNFFLQNILTLI